MRFSLSSRMTFLLLAAITAFKSFGADIKGSVTDSGGESLGDATIRLLAAKDSAFIKGTIADTNGRFTIPGVARGKYIVEATFIGFNKGYKAVEVQNSNVSLEPIKLTDSSVMLDEAVVTAIKTPIKVMEDTVEFNAASYRTAPNAVVEDLLKRLPGVEVDADGKITANGKEVSKILIEGKEFFSDDPKVASKNLPVDMVEKLQVVDRKSDLARLTGVDDGEEETVINLTVKPGMKNGWFGAVEGGYGTDDRYKFTFNVNRFWNGNQITFIGNANNTNELGFTDGNGNRFRRFGGDNGINNSQSFGINFNVGKEDIFRVGGNVMYSHTDRDSRTRENRTYLLSDDNYFTNLTKNANDRGHNIRADFRIEWKPDSFNTLDISPNLSININDSDIDEFSISHPNKNTTTSLNLSNSHGKSYEAGARIIYNHNFKNHRGRSLSFFGNYNFSNVREHASTYSYNLFHLWNESLQAFDEDSLDVYDQYNTNHTWSNQMSTRLSWTEPLGDVKNGNFITFSYNFRYRWNNADKLVYDRPVSLDDVAYMRDYELNGSLYQVPIYAVDYAGALMCDSLSNRFRNDFFSQDIRVGYKKVTRNANFEGGISIVPTRSKSINLINEAKNIPERWVWNYAPYMRFRYKFNQMSSLNLHYRGRSSQPSMSQLQPVADYSDPLRVVQGNPNLLPTFNHNIQARFQNFNPERQQSIMAMAFIDFSQNSIVSKTTFNPETGGQFTTYENVNGVWNARLMNMFSTPFRNKTFTFSNHLFLNYNQAVGFNNALKNTSRSIMAAEMFMIAWRPENVSIELRPNYRIQKTYNTLKNTGQGNLLVHNYGVGLDAYYRTPFGLILATDVNYNGTKGYANGYDTNTWMWNASVSYEFLRSRALTLQVKVYDILRQRQQIMRNVTANFINDMEYNTLSRYFMVSLTYKFNTFGKGNEPDDMNRGPRFGPPGGGRPVGPPPGHP